MPFYSTTGEYDSLQSKFGCSHVLLKDEVTLLSINVIQCNVFIVNVLDMNMF